VWERYQVSFNILSIAVHPNPLVEFFKPPGSKVLAALTFYFGSQLHENMLIKWVVNLQVSQYSQMFSSVFDITDL